MMDRQMPTVENIDVEWLEYGLRQDAAYIADLTLNGKHEEATAYIRRVDYVARMQAWKAARRLP